MKKRSYKFRIFKTILVALVIFVFVYGLGRIIYDVVGVDNGRNNQPSHFRYPSNTRTT